MGILTACQNIVTKEMKFLLVYKMAAVVARAKNKNLFIRRKTDEDNLL